MKMDHILKFSSWLQTKTDDDFYMVNDLTICCVGSYRGGVDTSKAFLEKYLHSTLENLESGTSTFLPRYESLESQCHRLMFNHHFSITSASLELHDTSIEKSIFSS